MKLLTTTAILVLGLTCANAYATNAANNQSTKPAAQPTTQPAQPSINNEEQMQSTQAINKAKGDEFLAKNRLEHGVITLPDGLQYKVISEGKGQQPTDRDIVVVNYEGHLIDGTEFDSSYKRGEPATFPVNGVIAGWTEALKLMNVGSTWELYIPSELAYGVQGMPPIIGPNQTLTFKVNLIAIKK